MKVSDIEEYLKDNFDLHITPPQIYYWENMKLLGDIERLENGRRVYTQENAHRVTLIALLYSMNVSLKDIKKLIIEKNANIKIEIEKNINSLENKRLSAIKRYLTNQK